MTDPRHDRPEVGQVWERDGTRRIVVALLWRHPARVGWAPGHSARMRSPLRETWSRWAKGAVLVDD